MLYQGHVTRSASAAKNLQILSKPSLQSFDEPKG